jgi:hypothetical protein
MRDIYILNFSILLRYFLFVVSLTLLITAPFAFSGTDINRDSRTDLQDVSFVNEVLTQKKDISQLYPDNGSNLKLGMEDALSTLQVLSKPVEFFNSSWVLKMSPIEDSLSTNHPECELEEDEILFRFIRSGNTLTLAAVGEPQNATGTIDGTKITFSGSHTETDDGSIINVSYSGILDLTSYNQLNGEMHLRITVGPYYCEWDQTVDGNLVTEVIPQFYGSFTHEKLTTRFFSTIDVADNGVVYINNFTSGTSTYGQTVEMVNSSLTDIETLTYNNEPIQADVMVKIDNSQNIHFKRYGLLQADNCIYNTLSKSLECSSFFGSGNVYLGAAEDIDSQGNHYMIPESGSGTDNDGRHLFLWKVSPDHQVRIASLEKESMLSMFPPSPEVDSFMLNDIRIAPDGRIFICVVLEGANNSDKDGLLILNPNMEKIQYFGNNWRFNFPISVGFDSSGNIFVADTYHHEIVILNNQLLQVGAVKWSDIPEAKDENDFFPIDLRVKNNKLYIYSSVNNQGALHMFDL